MAPVTGFATVTVSGEAWTQSWGLYTM